MRPSETPVSEQCFDVIVTGDHPRHVAGRGPDACDGPLFLEQPELRCDVKWILLSEWQTGKVVVAIRGHFFSLTASAQNQLAGIWTLYREAFRRHGRSSAADAAHRHERPASGKDCQGDVLRHEGP